jgi:DNA invertase Pin-like site-specific DNA recombinase
MKVAYIRVSTKEQNTARQDEVFKEMGIDKIFSEKISGKNTNRPQLNAMLEFVREDDILYIESLSRLGRSTKDLIEIVEELTRKKVQLVSLKENIDTTNAAGKLMFHMFASLAEFERDTLRQRQKEGIAIAKRKGRFTGKRAQKISENFKKIYELWEKEIITGKEAVKKSNLPKSTFYKLAKRYKEEKEAKKEDVKND